MKKIQELIKHLPNKDPEIAEKLLEKRDFSELSLLVWSDIVKTEKAQRRKICPEEYKDVEMDTLLELKMEIDKFNMDSLYG